MRDGITRVKFYFIGNNFCGALINTALLSCEKPAQTDIYIALRKRSAMRNGLVVFII